MFRQLHFLLPNIKEAKSVVNELHSLGINDNDIQTCSNDEIPAGALPHVSDNKHSDRYERIESLSWNGNLILFFIALAVLIIAAFNSQFMLAIVCVIIMLMTFVAGHFYSTHIPHTHLNNFKHALSHHELLLSVNVPDERLFEVENSIHRHHPSVIEGGSSWAIKA